MQESEQAIISQESPKVQPSLIKKVLTAVAELRMSKLMALVPVGLLTIGVIVTVTLSLHKQIYQQRASALNGVHDSGVLVLEYFPQDPQKPGYLDPQQMNGVIETQDLLSNPISFWENKVNGMISDQIQFMAEASKFHGYEDPSAPAALTFHVVDTKKYYTPIPPGFREPNNTGPFLPNYGKILKDVNICNYVDNQDVKEIWMFGYHTAKIVPDESRASSKYGTVSNTPIKEESPDYAAFRMPKCAHSYVLYNYTYQRDLGTMIHDRIHQFENAIPFAEGQWPATPQNRLISLFWSSFALWGTQKNSCGNAHFPPNLLNQSEEYHYTEPRSLLSNCETWNPDPSKTTYVSTSCAVWGCTELGYYKWWLQNIPGLHNGIWDKGKKMRNWWEAMYDFDGFIDRGKSLYCTPKSSSESDCSDSPITPTSIPSSTPTVIPTAHPTTTPSIGTHHISPTTIQRPTSTVAQNISYAISLDLRPVANDGIQTSTKQAVLCFYMYDPSIEPGNDFNCKNAVLKQIVPVVLSQGAYINKNILVHLQPTNSYIVTVKFINSVPKRLPFPIILVPNQIVSLPAVILRSGDLNKDGSVNTSDVQYLLTNCYGNKASSGSCNKQAADFNDDNTVDGIDYSMLLNAIAKKDQ